MRLGALKRHWERLGRNDPFWAVLTGPGKERGGWEVDRFYQSGIDEIGAVLDRARALGLPVPTRRALDFGCGAGRLTQAMAGRFEHTDGVDISAPMLDVARRYDRHPGRCTYHLNTEPDLRLFEGGRFSFVYSTIVLQHMEPRYSMRYMAELVRVLAPDGLLVFQQPSHRTAEEPSSAAARTAIQGRLPPAACRAGLRVEAAALALTAGLEKALTVTVENRSRSVWPALPDAKGRFQLNLANHWLHDDGSLAQRDDARCPLPHDLPPGAAVELLLGIRAPHVNGPYLLELDVVQENVGWFAQQGSQTLRVPCTIDGGEPAPPRAAATTGPATPSDAPPFRLRHPRVFRVLSATRIRDAYWSWRRGVDRVKHRRDRAVWWLTEHVYERIVPPTINWWRSRPFAARMDMHCVPRAEVLAIVEAAGARVVDVEQELMPGGYQSCRYWVVKR